MNKFNLGKVRGEDGKSATIAIGTVRTGQAGSDASVDNAGDSLRAIFDFTIPRGDKGEKGDRGNEAYSAGSNVQISGGVISATDTKYAPATPSTDGLMSKEDKVKLNGIAAGATKNATNAQLRDRATHTGEQPISSVTGLQNALDGKVENNDPRMTNSREWTATVVSQAEAEAGTATTRRAWTAQRVRQAIAAWWNGITSTLGRTLVGRTTAAAMRGDLGLGNVDNTSDADKPVSTAQQTALDGKVDKISGKQLSTEDFTSALKDKLTSLEGTHWRGTFVSLAALQAGVTDPVAGDYADVDAAGADVERYIWDATDSVWVVQSGSVAPITASQVKQLYESNSDTNAFTDAEKGKLGGIQSGAQVNTVTSVNSRTGAVTGLVENTDSRLTNSREWTAATVSQEEAEAGTSSTRRAWTAQRVRQAINAWWQLVTSGFGRNFIAASNEQAARNVLQLGTAATRDVGTASGNVMQVGAGNLLTSARTPTPEFDNIQSHFGIGKPTSLNVTAGSDASVDFGIGIFSSVPNTEYWLGVGALSGRVTVVHKRAGQDFIRRTMLDLSDISQNTGNSANLVMSQKAVTNAIAARGFADASGILTETSGALSNDMSSYLSSKTYAEMRTKLGVVPVNVVQDIGTSTEDVMSQKAVTDAISSAASAAPVVVANNATVTLTSNQVVYAVNTSSAPVTLTLPASPTAGAKVIIIDYANTFQTNACTVARNGKNIEGAASNLSLHLRGQSVTLLFVDNTVGWKIIAQSKQGGFV